MTGERSPVRLDLTDDELAARLLAIQRAAYRVEADLIGSDAIPQLHESLDELRAADETWHGLFVDSTVAGAISHRVVDGVVDIHRLVVDPVFFRRGIARRLVEHLQATVEAREFIVSTGAANTPARALYERLGYDAVGTEEVVPGLTIAHYRRVVAAD